MLTFPTTLFANSEEDAWTFQSDNAASTRYLVTLSSGDLSWTDGTDTYTGNDVTFANWDDATVKTVTVTGDLANITAFNTSFFKNGNIRDTIDMTYLISLGGTVELSVNVDLTKIIPPTSSGAITSLQLQNSGLVDAQDWSGCNLSGQIKMNGNSSLVDFIFPSNSNAVSALWYLNTSLGVPNFDDMTGILSANSSSLWCYNIGLSVAEVNETAVKLDAIVSSGPTGRTFRIETNSAPDTSSGGYDGVAAITSLEGKGVTCTTD